MLRPERIAAIVASLLAIAGLFVAAYVALAVRHVDSFYAEALNSEQGDARKASQQLENRVSELYQQSPQARWDATFTEDQVNGWLAVTLDEKLPKLLPPQVKDPRIGLTEDRFLVGFRYEGQPLSTVVSIEADATMPKPGVVAMRLRAARAGLLPLSSSSVVHHVSAMAAKLRWPIKWEEVDGAPVLVVPMLDLFSTDTESRRLEQVKLREGELSIAGSAEPKSDDPATPQITPASVRAARTSMGP